MSRPREQGDTAQRTYEKIRIFISCYLSVVTIFILTYENIFCIGVMNCGMSRRETVRIPGNVVENRQKSRVTAQIESERPTLRSLLRRT